MNLNTDGLLTRFYKRTYHRHDYELPTNFCSFFWKLFFAVSLLPATWWTYLCEDFVDRAIDNGGFMSKRVAINMMFLLLAFILGVILWAIGAAFWYHLYVASSVTGGILVFATILYVVMRVRNDDDPLDVFADVADVVAAKVESVKDGYCPRIEWR
jgi:hypothetical protein